MRRFVSGWLVIALAAMVMPASAGDLDPGLVQYFEQAPAGQPVSVLVFHRDQVNLEAVGVALDARQATLQLRHETVVRALREKAESTQANLRDHLKGLQALDQNISFEAFWITNAFEVTASPEIIRALANHPDVQRIYLNYEIELIAPVAEGPVEPARGVSDAPEPGVVAVRAPEVWAMGFTGADVVVANMDTGVDGNHPALASRWVGVADPRYANNPEWGFFDPVTNRTFPFDSGTHGTHTMGSVCGGAPGDEVGVAPGATWIAMATIDRVSINQTIQDAILSFQWMIDPDGDPNTNWDAPAVCSNSWGLRTSHGPGPCDPTFWSYIDACEEAGIVIIFSAGNEGFTEMRRPADRATDDYRTMAVAAVNANLPGWPIASFSSRGPTTCTPTGQSAIKPEISAPGDGVRSAVPGGYGSKDGTSMASPHVNGVVALMREACPDLTVEEIKQIIYETAHDLGAPGKDNDYGYGMIDAFEAVNMALTLCGPNPPRVFNGFFETAVNTPVTMVLRARDDGTPFPLEYVIETLPAGGQDLIDPANGHVIEAGELPYTLLNGGNEVTYSPANNFYGEDTFTWYATDGGVPPTGGRSLSATTTILVMFDAPTILTSSLPDGCLDRPYGPVQLEASQGQPEMTWSVVTDQYVENGLGSSLFSVVGTGRGWQGDDLSFPYTLPFTFPFYGQDYTSCNVCTNGFIDFASNTTDYTNSLQEMIDNERICVMWDDLRTDRRGGDIFIDESVAGQVTIRWMGEMYSPTGTPMDISTTLYQDGSIEFHYGPGNSSLSTTVGVSAGDGTRYLVSRYDGAPALTNAESVEILAPVPLPTGLMLSPAGELSGTPVEAGAFQPRFKVVDALGRSDVKQLDLLIEATCGTPGDMNCDGFVDNEDIDPFVLAVTQGQAAYQAAWPNCEFLNGDINGDGFVDNEDIDPFVALITGP